MTDLDQSKNEGLCQLGTCANDHQQELSAWNNFIDKYKGNLAEQGAREMFNQYGLNGRQGVFAKDKGRELAKWLMDRIQSSFIIRTSPGKDIYGEESIFRELLELPEIPLTYGVLEKLLENALPTATSLREMSETICPRGPLNSPEDVYGNGNLGCWFGEQIIKAYAERTFLGDVYAGS